MTKTLPVTEEIIELGNDYLAAIECRDICIKSIFKTKKAIYYQKQSTKILNKFWSLVHQLHPQTQFENWTYNAEERCLALVEQNDEDNG